VEAVVRALAMYALLPVMLRVSARRTLGELGVFVLVLLLVISQAAQQALMGEDFSFVNDAIVTLAVGDIGLLLLRRRWPRRDEVIEGVSIVRVHDRQALHERPHTSRVDEEDIHVAARRQRGLTRLDQIRLAALGAGGHISIIARGPAG
jgi:uncharacterized membrane protein YcaP (DUF421 family)